MNLRRPNGANTANASRTTGWISSRRSCLRVALLLLSTGVLIAAATVAAAQVPGSQAAYDPPRSPDSLLATHASTRTSSTLASPLTVASSWSMSPLPEGEGGTVTSSTAMSPITPNSSVVASPQ